MQQDVLRSQVEISLLLQKVTMLEQQRATAQARLNTLLARAPEAPLPPAADVNLTPLDRSLASLYAAAETNDTSLQRDQQMVEKNQLAVQLAHKDYLPDFGVAHTLQTGNDTEYTLVILALCAGVAYSFARFIFKSLPLGIVAKNAFASSVKKSFFSAPCSFTLLLFDTTSPPPLPLRI